MNRSTQMSKSTEALIKVIGGWLVVPIVFWGCLTAEIPQSWQPTLGVLVTGLPFFCCGMMAAVTISYFVVFRNLEKKEAK